MQDPKANLFPEETILLFGGHILSQTKQSLDTLVQGLAEGSNSRWIADAVAGLPEYWDALEAKIPEVAATIPGRRLLADLDSWLRHGYGSGCRGPSEDNEKNLPNVVVGPLLVAIQLNQYCRYLEFQRFSAKGTKAHDDGNDEDLHADLVSSHRDNDKKVEVLGFCAGLLAAVAVAGSSNMHDLARYGAAAMRMAMLIGAVIDAREEWDRGLGKGGSVSYATAWRGPQQHGEMTRILEAVHPEAYVSVILDESRATVTTTERSGPSIVRRLRAAGLTVVEIGIRGSIHSPGEERRRHTEAIMAMCREMPGLAFPDAKELALPTYNNQAEGKPVARDRGDLADMVLRSVMMLQCNWYGTFSKAVAGKNDATIIAFGLDRCIPPTMLHGLSKRQQHFEDIEKEHPLTRQRQQQQQQQNQTPQETHENGINGRISQNGNPPPATQPLADDSASTAARSSTTNPQPGQDAPPPAGLWDKDSIAVVGMSIKVAGADDLDEFAAMLKTGQSQHELIIRGGRLEYDYMFRDRVDADPKRPYYANFVRDHDAFDHKFFKRSPRESQAMDPQSRLCLQGAYEAVEQSGYFAESFESMDNVDAGATTTTSDGKKPRDKLHVGVYLGNCGVDYEHNISCHMPNAFTATGGLKSFIVGRLSHHFGWTGPALTFDTACSSSAVAVHTACRNLLSGECSAALCGGVNIITNMLWMQNLAAGSFISHTGQCKPFDERADGYCRAEGMAFVFLKKLSDAVADGNPVLATIPATAVYQNLNCTPLFVPNAASLTVLFRDAIRQSGVAPSDVSLVEAHGTGTPVGDPAEWESVRNALGGPIRPKKLPVGSVKGHIGHTEGASGLIALVKVIVMMRGGFIPPQASFTTLNRQIQVRPDDMMEVVTELRPWDVAYKLALLNNYGACGSNASVMISQPPPASFLSELADVHGSRNGSRWRMTKADDESNTSCRRFPFWIAGFDARSIAAYSAKIESWLQKRGEGDDEKKATLPDMSYIQRSLPQGLVFSCGSLAELRAKLRETIPATKETAASFGIAPCRAAERPIILCFGGQVSAFVGLDPRLYAGVAVLRRHLDECDAVITASAGAGLPSIYPAIFVREPVEDPVRLQTMLFASQYACARAWLDCGVSGKVAAVVGHSFGEITALCVAGVLSLADAVKLVAGRAALVRDAWGPDPGAMMAVVEADESLVQGLVAEANRRSDGSAGIACYNGPRSFTLAGSTPAIDAAAEVLRAGDARFSGVKAKRLAVTNAFHSTLVNANLVDRLGQVGKDLTFNEPAIPVERSTESSSSTSVMDWTFVPTHMRKPVFFNHALQRLAKKHPQAIFLEAGSSSTITVMAGRALSQSQMASASTLGSHHFQAMAITGDKGFDGLVDATVSLWRQGLHVSFWAHHPSQAREYAQLLLPPYQFDKSGRHWLEIRSPAEEIQKAAEELIASRGLSLVGGGEPVLKQQQQQQDARQDPKTMNLWSFVGYQDKKIKKKPRFRVNTASDKYNHFFAGHVIAQTAPICPATLESDMAIECLFSLHPEWRAAGLSPVVRDLVNHSPICADPSRTVYIDLAALDDFSSDSPTRWSVVMLSVSSSKTTGNGTKKNDSEVQVHVEARLHFRSPTDPDYLQEFARYERLVGHKRCKALLALASLDGHQAPNDSGGSSDGKDDDGGPIDVLRGRNVYRAFRDVVDYPELYRGVRAVVGRGRESAGVVAGRHQGQTWLDVPLSDSFSQVGGMWVNLMTDLPAGDMYIATGCEASMRSPRVRTETDNNPNGPGLWHVFAQHSPRSDKEYTTDVFVFDAATGKMTEAMLGIQYGRVAKASMSKMLARLTKDESLLRTGQHKTASSSSSQAPPTTTSVKTPGAVPAAPLVDITHGGVLPASSVPGVKSPKKQTAAKKSGKEGSKKQGLRRDITDDVRNLVATVSGIETSEFTLDTEMADLGIDSLMGMELAREVEIVFKCTLDQTEQMEATSLRKFVACVANALEKAGIGSDDNNESSSTDGDDSWSRPSRDNDTSDISVIPADTDTFISPEKHTTVSPLAANTPRGAAAASDLTLSRSDILESFGEIKMLTDNYMREHGLDTINKVMIAASNRLCVALVVEALEKLGMPLRAASRGQALERVAFAPQHGRLMECLYEFLERDARLVDVDVVSGELARTSVEAPRKTSDEVLHEVLAAHPGFAVPNRMTHYAGGRLADVLAGTTDGIRVIFGTPEGRDLVQAMYCEHTFNYMNYLQMRDVIGRLVDRIRKETNKKQSETSPLKVLEMGAGTGGTTLVVAPFLASLAASGLPVEYTFTDLSPSMVANARRRFGPQYPFMRFAVHDIEKPPAEEHRGQHIVLASNAVHATHDLVVSCRNVRQALRPDGFLMILEMTEVVPFVDIVFGLLEGWWLFDDGRRHAVVPAEHWERELHAAGFGHVDWTDGALPENAFQKVIMALASGPPESERLPKAAAPPREATVEEASSVAAQAADDGALVLLDRGDVVAREAEADSLVSQYTRGWATPELLDAMTKKQATTAGNGNAPATRESISGNGNAAATATAAIVVVTGATGSLGAHLVQQFADHAGVATVVCLNRASTSTPAEARQAQAFSSRGIVMSAAARAKLRVLEADTTRPQLGLPAGEYAWLVGHATHVVHNAWPMSATRALKGFEPQMRTLRNLLDLARDMATTRTTKMQDRIGFQLVSSIGVVGHAGQRRILEGRVPLSAALPGGYAEAKWVCERMLDETLHRYPALFRPMTVRPGQISGSTVSGYWNPVEHFAFLVKSAQTLRAWPDLDGVLQWLPVDQCASVMAELLKIEEAAAAAAPDAYPIYHIDNPVGQPWKAMSPVIATALDIPPHAIVPFETWIHRVRRSPLPEEENPAARLADFLEVHFERMSCGGLILDTKKTQEHSEAMAGVGPVSADLARRYIETWKEIGFLSP